MDFSNFQLAKEDEGSYTISHPNGKALKIGKKGLSEKAHEVIAKLKKVHNYADGGGVASDAINQLVDAPAPAQFAPSEAPAAPIAEAPPVAPQAVPSSGEIPIGGGATASWEPSDAGRSPSSQGDPLIEQKLGTEDVLNKQEEAARGYQKETSQAHAAEGKAYQDYNKLEAGRQTAEDIVQGYKAKDDQLAKAYLDNKIDPNRYLANQSTGSKIAASIGLLFSGFGSGASGQKNMALDQINGAIANDIDAQKNEQGKQQTLWQMNQKALGNDLAAHAATENQLWTGVQAKIAQASNGVQNAETKLKAQEMINQIEQQKVQNRLKLGVLTQGESGQGGMGGRLKADPLQLVNELITDPAQRSKAIEEIGKAQHVTKNQAEMIEQFDKATNENTLFKTGAGLVRTPASILRLRELGQPLIRDEAGRPSEIQQKIYNDLLPGPGDTDSKIAEKRLGMISFWNRAKQAPNATANGINLNNFASTNGNTFQSQPKNDQYLAWAKANPTTKIGSEYLKANGG